MRSLPGSCCTAQNRTIASAIWLIGSWLILTLFASPSFANADPDSFNNPTNVLTINNLYGTGGTGHCGDDYADSTVRNATIYSTNYGVVERVVNNLSKNYKPTGPLNTCSSYAANLVLIKHILNNGNTVWTRYLHFAQGTTPLVTDQQKIVKNQKIGIEGNVGCASGNHLHYEVNTKISATSVGALPGKCEDTKLATNATSPAPYLEGGTARVLLPFLSRTIISIDQKNYDVYGIVNQPVYGALALNPEQDKTFNNVGIGGVVYGTNTSDDLFLNKSAKLSSIPSAIENSVFIF
jgi:hypothetical protein